MTQHVKQVEMHELTANSIGAEILDLKVIKRGIYIYYHGGRTKNRFEEASGRGRGFRGNFGTKQISGKGGRRRLLLLLVVGFINNILLLHI